MLTVHLRGLKLQLFVCVVQQYGVQGYPTIKYFNDKDQPADYQGGRDAASMAAFVLDDWRKAQPRPEVTYYCLHVFWFDCIVLGHQLQCTALAARAECKFVRAISSLSPCRLSSWSISIAWRQSAQATMTRLLKSCA